MLLLAGAALGTCFHLSRQQLLSAPEFVTASLATAVPAGTAARDLCRGRAELGVGRVRGQRFRQAVRSARSSEPAPIQLHAARSFPLTA